MALKGTLRDFGIGDIFQLIQQQSKAGILMMRDRETEVRVLFDGGKIVGAESTGQKQQKEPLGVLLVRAGLVQQANLDAALAVQQKTLRKLGDILVQEGGISKADLKSFLALQTRETLNRLFRWRSGDYEFVPQAVKYDAEMVTALSPEHVLMDGFRMIDEWPSVQKVIHGLESIPAVPKGVAEMVVRKERPAPGHEADDEDEDDDDDDEDAGDDIDAAFAEFEDGAKPKEKKKPSRIKLSAAETIVFDLIDGKRTVQEIVDRSLLGEFNTCNALKGLIEKGAAGIVGRKRVDDAGRIPVVERARGEGLKLALGALLSIAVLVVSAAALVVLGLGADAAVGPKDRAVPYSGTALDAISAHRVTRATHGAEVFWLANGRWPKDTAELLAGGYVAKTDVVDPSGRELLYDAGTGRFSRPAP